MARAITDRFGTATVLSPPGDQHGVVPVFLFRTRAVDFLGAGFNYCDMEAAESEDCNGDGVPDSCQVPLRDCNGDGVLDACQFDDLPWECRQGISFVRGDPNADGDVDLSDAVIVLGFLFLEEPKELLCPKSADCNDDGVADVSDSIHLLGFLFLGTEPPVHPFRQCGSDLTDNELSCESYAPCGR